MGEGQRMPFPRPMVYAVSRPGQKSQAIAVTLGHRRGSFFFAAGSNYIGLRCVRNSASCSAMFGRFSQWKRRAARSGTPDLGGLVPGLGLITAGVLVVCFPQILSWIIAGMLISAGVVTLLLGW